MDFESGGPPHRLVLVAVAHIHYKAAAGRQVVDSCCMQVVVQLRIGGQTHHSHWLARHALHCRRA
jgi:hypothetical protein